VTELEDLAFRARFHRDITTELLRKARALRRKAEKLEKESDRVAAAAAMELAEALESTAKELWGA